MTASFDVKNLTLDEKASLTSGGDLWHLQAIPAKGIPGWMITDGPHGLRKAVRSDTATDQSIPSTCFPPAAGLSSSWDPDLIEAVGRAMAEECIQEQVGVILGPGVNIKRNPLGGRSFEFWSEDPLLAGVQANSLVEGIQSQGVGTSLKHFAANNQESDRLRVSARVSERAMREIYLPAFEYVIKHANPWTVMCSYNKVNGVYSAQNHRLLTEILRDEWGYGGVVMSEWGACHDRVASLAAGLNLEMPPSHSDDQIVSAVREGRLDESTLDARAQELLDLAAKAAPAMSREGYRYDPKDHQNVARAAARESMVLLANRNGVLSLSDGDDFAVVGEFARTPRYQGGGSSHITPTEMSSFLDALGKRGIEAEFAPGFTLDDADQDEALTNEALEVASRHDVTIVFVGLPESTESEGYDRKTMDIPAKQIKLLHGLAAVGSHLVVILSNGSSVVTSTWQKDADAIIEGWLLGQAGGDATADVVFGDCSPSGKLAQSIPVRLEDDPSYVNFPGGEGTVDYGEGVFVGYRYYDTVGREVSFPFGFGLSYTTFRIDGLRVEAQGPCGADVEVTVTNTGSCSGAETVQLYVAPKGPSPVARPSHELRAFEKVALQPGESRKVSFDLDSRAFAYWSEARHDWHVEAGDYGIEVGSSSRDISCREVVSIEGDGNTLELNDFSTYAEWMADPVGAPILTRAQEGSDSERVQGMLRNPKVLSFIQDFPLTMLEAFGGSDVAAVCSAALAEYHRAREARRS
ncbi:glycoside hydrolase family 3 C-terminal domain-containing protein [uncultured Bifidobacterium sp.]|uniref:glycoside hydrolase family 3 C-terminal domain-containing protein n=1 Tax=uncultured Bifidobacterium sp. TaxID=165187 RepID=UPI00260DCBC5|nr:glycoside hydrolase family 3 C-terminal domain-containing protein [uncultured Bifidobacterium sp.]